MLYICRIHGNTSNEVKVGSKSLDKATSLEELMNKADETWILGKNVYGGVTYVKVKVGEKRL